ncbi:MAG: helix-turn-helix domain containing protein [Patulibacter minatonensis]
MSPAGRQYGGRSPEDRRDDRRQRLLAAGLALIGETGLAALTVRGVCARAGLTPRYFYEEFGTGDALARELFDREFDRAQARVLAAVSELGDGRTTLELVRAAVGVVARVFTENPARAAVLLTESSGTGPLAERRAARMDDLIAVLSAFGRSSYGSGDAPLGEAEQAIADRSVRVAASFVAGGLAQTLDAWLRGELGDAVDPLVDELAEQIVAVGDAANARLVRTIAELREAADRAG